MNAFRGFDFGVLLRSEARDLALESLIFLLDGKGEGKKRLQEIAVWQSGSSRPHANAMIAAKDSFVVARQITPAASLVFDDGGLAQVCFSYYL